MSDPREGETWAVRHLLAEGVIVDAHVHGIVDGQLKVSQEGRQDQHVEDDVLFTFAGDDRQHRCPLAQFKRLYVRRVAIAGELRRIVSELRKIAEGDVSLRALADEIDAQADMLTVGLL